MTRFAKWMLPVCLGVLLSGVGLCWQAALAQSPAVLSASMALGGTAMTGQVTPGTDLAIEIVGPNGKLRGGAAGVNVRRSGSFTAPLVDASGQPLPVVGGDRARLVLGGTSTVEQLVPMLTIQGRADTDRVLGTGPANTPVTVTLVPGLFRQPVRQNVTTDQSGAFSADFAGKFDMTPDTTLRAEVLLGVFLFRVERPLTEQLNVRLFDATLSGVGPNGSQVRAELRAGRTVKATGQGSAAFLGRFNFSLADASGDPVPVSPGDSVRLEFVGISTFDYLLPDLTAVPDSQKDTVSGKAPAGSELSISAGAGFNVTTVTATVGAAGSYAVSFGPPASVDLQPGTTGQAEAVVRAAQPGLDVVLSRTWAVTQLSVRLGEPTVSGVSSAGAPIQLTLQDSRGNQRATATAEVAAGGGFFGTGGGTFQTDLLAKNGDPVDVVPGQTLQFRRQGESIDLPIPVLTALVDTDTDLVTGQAPAGSPVQVTAGQNFGQRTRVVTATAEGRYEATFAGQLDLAAGSQVTVQITRPGGHLVSLATAAASLRVWPEVGHLDGTVASGAEVAVTVLPASGTVPLATGDATANFRGGFDADLTDAAGRLYFPKGGERVRAVFGTTSIEMVVPALSFDWDFPGDRIYGETVPDGRVTVTARPPSGQGIAAATETYTVTQSGYYETKFAGKSDLRPGSRIQLTYTYPNGNRMRMDRTLPMLNIQVGGNAVAGFAVPRSNVSAKLLQSGVTVGTGKDAAANDATFDLRLTDGRAKPSVIAADQTVDVTYDLRHMQVGVGPLQAALALGSARLTGIGPISRSLEVRFEAPLGQVRNAVTTAATDLQGSFGITVPRGISVTGGTRAEVAYLNEEGHRLYTLAVLPQLAAYVGSDRVAGQAPPLGEVAVAQSAAGGAVLNRANTGADTQGRFALSLGRAAKLVPGQTLSADFKGAAAATQMTVEDVQIAIDGSRIQGRIPPSASPQLRLLQVVVTFQGSLPARTLNVQAAADGTFEFDAANPPGPGAGFEMASVSRIEAVFTAQTGHQTIAVVRPKLGIYLPVVRSRQ